LLEAATASRSSRCGDGRTTPSGGSMSSSAASALAGGQQRFFRGDAVGFFARRKRVVDQPRVVREQRRLRGAEDEKTRLVAAPLRFPRAGAHHGAG